MKQLMEGRLEELVYFRAKMNKGGYGFENYFQAIICGPSRICSGDNSGHGLKEFLRKPDG